MVSCMIFPKSAAKGKRGGQEMKNETPSGVSTRVSLPHFRNVTLEGRSLYWGH